MPGGSRFFVGVQRGDVAEEHAMDDAGADADFAQRDALGRVVKEGGEAAGKGTPSRRSET
jgi:hypothetical protein